MRLLSLAWVKLNCEDIAENRVGCTDSAPDARTCFRARAVHFGRDRFGGTDGISPAKWPPGVGDACFERPLWTSHQEWRIQNSREGANPLLEHVRKNCRCPRKYNRGRCRCGHARSSGREIYPGADALFHAVHRGGRDARRIPAGLSCITRLCSDARAVRNCVFQLSQCGDAGHSVRPNTDWTLSRAIAIQISAALRSAVRAALCPTAAALVAVRCTPFGILTGWCWRSWARAKDRQDRPGY